MRAVLEQKAVCDLRGGERAVRPRVAPERPHAAAPRQARGTPSERRPAGRHRRRHGRDRRPRPLTRQLGPAEPHAERAALAEERLGEPAVVLAVDERPGPAQEVVQLVRVSRNRSQRRLDLLDRPEVEQLSELLDSHELAEEVAVERERLRTPLLGRRVVLVHVRRDVVEEERRRERRRRRGLDVHDGELPRLQAAQDPAQRRQVEHVLQALAERLEHDRELRVAACDLEQALRLQPLLPERRPLARPAPRDRGARGPRSRGSALRRAPTARARRGGDPRSRPARAAGRRAAAARRHRGSAARCRRPTTATARRDRATRAAARAAPSPRARARDRRTARGCRRASRRSRRESARRRASGRRGRHRSTRSCSRRNVRRFRAASASSP